MTDEEIKDKLRKMLFLTQRANECGLSNNDFKEDIDTLSGALGLLDKKDKAIEEIQTFCRNQLAFQNRLVRSKEKITEFNNGRFDVCEEILYIIDTEEER